MSAGAPGRWLYGLLLRLYPTAFRERYGAEMRAFHHERVRECRASGGSVVALWIAVLTDVLSSACAERLRAARLPTPLPPSVNKEHEMHTLMQDLSYAVRSLRRRPAFTIVVVATIALGVGANAAIFSVVNGILLRPLPYPAAHELITFGHEPPTWLTSDPNFIDYQRGIPSMESLAAYTQSLATLSSDGEPDRVRAARVSREFFGTLRVTPVRGRVFAPEEFVGSPPTAVVLSHGLWQRRFGGDTSIVNRTLMLNGVKRTIVGVMPRHFNYPEARTDLWVPMPFNAANPGHRSNNYLFLVGRIKHDAGLERVRNEAKAVAARIMTDNPGSVDPSSPLRPRIEAMQERLVSPARPYLFALLGTVGFVLLIACANVANLMLARAESRRREMAVRSALGASRRRLITQLFTEGGLIAFAGGALGLLLAWMTTRTLVTIAPGAIPRLDEVTIDWRVVMFTLAASAVTGLLISLVPATRAAGERSFEALKAGGRAGAHGVARGARRVLVVAEVALAVVALAGAGMLLRSLWNLEDIDTGFTPHGVLTARVSVLARDYNDQAAATFFQQLIDDIETVPGVQVAAAAGWLPVVDAGGMWGVMPEGRSYGPGSGSSDNQPSSVPQQVTPGYFEAIGIRLRAGREFTPADREGAPYVAIVSAGMAKALWPGENALGKRFRVGGGNELPLMTVVGIAGDIRARGFTDTPEPTMYFPHAQTGRTAFVLPRAMSLVVRTSGDPMALAGAVKAKAHARDAAAPVSEIRTLEEVVGSSVATRRFSTSLLAAFAMLALLLAGIGTYGVIAYGVAQRTYEIGVRMALGAERGAVARLVMVEGIRMCAIGLVIGLAGVIALGVTIRSMLVGVTAIDPPSLLATALILLIVAALASAVPALRAVGVSPTEALRDG